MGKGGLKFLLLAALAVVGLVLWQQHRIRREREAREQAELQAGLDASRVLSATFARAAALQVATLTGRVRSRGECKSGYFFPDEQQTVAPYSVSYSVDLGKVDRSSYRWDSADRVMFVELPGVTVGPPNVDMSRARSAQSGMFVSRACGLAMQSQIAGRLQAAAGERANRPDYRAQARESARAAVEALVRAPLAAAGIPGVDVRVRFATDPRPADSRQWDVSRSIDAVLADPRFRK